MSQITDRELWQLSSDGHPEAFGELFERHSRPIYNYCFRRTASWTQAEDLTSAVFLEAWKRRKEIRLAHDSALPWLYGVASNLLRNHRRSQRRYRDALQQIPSPANPPDFTQELAARIDDEDRMSAVLTLVSRLPNDQLEALALCALAELSYDDAAFVLRVPVGTVRSRVSRARQRLRQLEAEVDAEGRVLVAAAKENHS